MQGGHAMSVRRWVGATLVLALLAAGAAACGSGGSDDDVTAADAEDARAKARWTEQELPTRLGDEHFVNVSTDGQHTEMA